MVTELIVILKPHIFATIYEYFIFVCFRKVATPLLNRNKAVFERLLRDMAIKSLVLQFKLMTLVILFVEICAKENVPIYCNKATGVSLRNDAVAGVKQYITC